MAFLMKPFLRLTPQAFWEATLTTCTWRSIAWKWHWTFIINESASPVSLIFSTACRDKPFSIEGIYDTDVASNSLIKFSSAKFTLCNSNLRKFGHDSAANLKISKLCELKVIESNFLSGQRRSFVVSNYRQHISILLVKI